MLNHYTSEPAKII